MAPSSMLRLTAAAATTGLAVGVPLIHSDVFHGTVELFQDMYTTAYAKAGIDDLIAKLPLEDVKKAVNAQVQSIEVPPQVTQAITDVQIMAIQTKGTISAHTETALEAANTHAKAAVKTIESFIPSFKGLIQASIGGLVLFTLWMALVLYIQYRVLKFALWIVYSMVWVFWCGICCCRLCRGKKDAKPVGSKGKAKAKAAAATNGKATNGTTAAKAPIKKK